MLKCGLVTVTFRSFDRKNIVRAAKNAGLSLLEWGGDIHVPPLDSYAIGEAVQLTAENGLSITAYGSYYSCTDDEEKMRSAVDTASLLGAETVRVWPGICRPDPITEELRREYINNLRKTCRYAASKNITVSTEYHPNTLTETTESAMRMIDEVADENLRLYWQPNQFMSAEYNIDSLKQVLPYLTNIHVFNWKGTPTGNLKFPLADGEAIWRQYIDIIASDSRDHGLLLEFVHDGTEEQFCRDAEALKSWLK
ncbi:MAG: sugar phosphate isomerase/epimerase [Ruminococcaceae bacterium]|nr:sugar phosphate isomerase/epimerase [Oscillospiraceae bacterium]